MPHGCPIVIYQPRIVHGAHLPLCRFGTRIGLALSSVSCSFCNSFAKDNEHHPAALAEVVFQTRQNVSTDGELYSFPTYRNLSLVKWYCYLGTPRVSTSLCTHPFHLHVSWHQWRYIAQCRQRILLREFAKQLAARCQYHNPHSPVSASCL